MIAVVNAMSVQTKSKTLSNKMSPASLSHVDAVTSLWDLCPGVVLPLYSPRDEQPSAERATREQASSKAKSLRQSVIALISFLNN